MWGVLATVSAVARGGAVVGPAEDAVATLPGYGTPPAPQWSGFLPGDQGGVMLHYWFASAEVTDPGSAPVVLWLNGGPGSSSILGMLQEHGPLLVPLYCSCLSPLQAALTQPVNVGNHRRSTIAGL